MEQFFLQLVNVTTTQIGAVLGFFLVLGFVLSQVQKFTQKQYYQSVGWFGILWTAWIGTPVHEISHYLFAKLFLHHIDSVSLFRPNYDSGKLGEVVHSYNPRNLYHQIGNFFIGAAPMIIGVCLLSVLFRYLLPNGQGLLTSVQSLDFTIPAQAFSSVITITKNLFSAQNIHSIPFWIFIYLSFAISSHLAPSSADQKTMWRGFVWLVLLTLIVNAIFLLLKKPVITSFTYNSLPFLVWAFWYALIVSVAHAIFSTIIFFPFKRR